MIEHLDRFADILGLITVISLLGLVIFTTTFLACAVIVVACHEARDWWRS